MQHSPLFKFKTFNLSHPILKFQIFFSHGNRCASATQSVRGPFSKRSSFPATLKPFRGPSWGDCDILFGQLDQLPRCLHIFQRGSKARFQQVWPLTIFLQFANCFWPLSRKILFSFVPPSNSLVSVSDPWRAFLSGQGHLTSPNLTLCVALVT